jgi:hypothetical protein
MEGTETGKGMGEPVWHWYSSRVIEQILKAKEDRQQLMFITLWFIWSERNLIWRRDAGVQ